MLNFVHQLASLLMKHLASILATVIFDVIRQNQAAAKA